MSHLLAQIEESKPLLNWLTGLGGFGVTIVVAWMVLTGRLVLRRELDRERGLLAMMETEKNEWKRAALHNFETTARSQELAGKAMLIAESTATGIQGPPGVTGQQGVQGIPGPRGRQE